MFISLDHQRFACFFAVCKSESICVHQHQQHHRRRLHPHPHPHHHHHHHHHHPCRIIVIIATTTIIIIIINNNNNDNDNVYNCKKRRCWTSVSTLVICVVTWTPRPVTKRLRPKRLHTEANIGQKWISFYMLCFRTWSYWNCHRLLFPTCQLGFALNRLGFKWQNQTGLLCGLGADRFDGRNSSVFWCFRSLKPSNALNHLKPWFVSPLIWLHWEGLAMFGCLRHCCDWNNRPFYRLREKNTTAIHSSFLPNQIRLRR